ncbi:MAG: TonB-dependent siderophore receptor [Pseudomonadales bacterium]|nr:TonB-dependent siderophore receptor [Pseudomonadales bacterium]
MDTNTVNFTTSKSKPSLMAMAVTATLPLSLASVAQAESTEVVELPKAEITAAAQDNYKVDKSTSIKYTQPLVDTPKSITVIPGSLMKDRNVDSLQEAIRTVPGISLAAGEGGAPTGDSMTIRGFSARNDILIDGVRDIAGYTRDIYNVEAVEVSKGPGSAVYGRGATGGSINLQTKTAKLDDFHDISLRGGTESDYRAQLDSNTSIGDKSALRINLLADDGEVAGRDHVENSKFGAAVSFATGIGKHSRFNINGDYQKQDNIPDYGIPWVQNYSTRDDRSNADWLEPSAGGKPPVDFDNFYGNLHRDFEDIEAKSVTAKYEYDLDHSTMIRLLGRVGTVERQSIITAPRFPYTTIDDVRVYGNPEGVITMADEKTRDTKDSLAVVQLDLVGSYKTGAIQHDIVTGVELAREKFERWNYIDIVDDNLDSTPVYNDLYNPDPNLAFTGRYGRGEKSDKATGQTTAFYVFDTLTLTPEWQVSLGGRYDIFDTEYYYELDGDDPSVKLDAKDSVFSWNLGVVYKIAPNGTVYIGAGSSFSPSADDLTASSRGNNADLDPEETISYELGTKWELVKGRVFTSAAIFRTEKTHARTDDPFASDSRDETLDGKQRVDGLEVSIAGQVTDELNITAAYTFQDSEVVKAAGDDQVQEGAELARTPEHSFSVWSRYDITHQFAVGLGAQYVGERFNSTDPGGREKADDYLLFDMMLSYQINELWSVQLNGSNLTDEDYISELGGGHFVPGQGRYLSLSTAYRF